MNYHVDNLKMGWISIFKLLNYIWPWRSINSKIVGNLNRGILHFCSKFGVSNWNKLSNKQSCGPQTNTHTLTQTDTSSDNTWRPKLTSGKKKIKPLLYSRKSMSHVEAGHDGVFCSVFLSAIQANEERIVQTFVCKTRTSCELIPNIMNIYMHCGCIIFSALSANATT